MSREDELQALIVTGNFREAESFIQDNNLDVDVSRHGWISMAVIFGSLNGDVKFLKFLSERDPALFNRRRLQTLLVGQYPDRSLLYYASKNTGMVETVKYLLQFCDCNGDTRVSALLQAVTTGDSFMVDALLRDGATLNAGECARKTLLLQTAAARAEDPQNALEIVNLLLTQTGRQRVYVNQLDGSMDTALCVATRHNLVDVAAALMRHAPQDECSIRDKQRAFEQAKEQQKTNVGFTAMVDLLGRK